MTSCYRPRLRSRSTVRRPLHSSLLQFHCGSYHFARQNVHIFLFAFTQFSYGVCLFSWISLCFLIMIFVDCCCLPHDFSRWGNSCYSLFSIPIIQCLTSIIFLLLLHILFSTWYSLQNFFGAPEVVIPLFISLPSHIKSTLFLTDTNLQCITLSHSPIILTLFPLNLFLFLLLLLSAVIFAAFLLMPFSRPQCCSQMLTPTSALLWRIFRHWKT